jgi:hypothetical protein
MNDTTHLTKRQVLEQATFGKRVAEEETELLSRYFVQTDQWKRLVSGDVDIIYGPKGSGKSALYSLLAEKFDILRVERRIVGLSAENPRGTPAFRDLVYDPPASEEVFRQLWKFYLLSLLAEYIRQQMTTWKSKHEAAQSTIEILVEVGLLTTERSYNLKGLLKRVRDFLSRRPIAVEGTVTAGETGIPELTGRLVFGEPSNDQRKCGVISADDAFENLNSFLSHNDVTIWFMLDRLDVAFTEDVGLEQNALRALFRTYLDLIGYKKLSIKIFLRDDIWRRITSSGFREASHITRTMTINWDAKTLQNLIVRRALFNESIISYYGVDPEEILANEEKQADFFYRLFPDQIAAGKNKTKTLAWMLSRIEDGHKRPAPRELIHLLTAARDSQLSAYQLGSPEPPSETLIGRAAIKDSLPEVSKVRLDTTLCAEYPVIKIYLEKIENGKAAYSPESLSRQLQLSLEQTESIAEWLVELGFFLKKSEKGNLIYWVPFIYRDALKLTQGSAE